MSRRSRAVSLAPVNYRSAYRGEESDPESDSLPAAGSYAGGKIEIVHGEALCPNAETRGESRYRPVAFNLNTDVLRREWKCKRISPGAYVAGVAIQKTAEAAGLLSWGGCGYEPSCGKGDREASLARKAAATNKLVDWSSDIVSIVGKDSALIVRGVLIDLHTFEEMSDGTAIGRRRIAKEFRDSLEAIALTWERRGHR